MLTYLTHSRLQSKYRKGFVEFCPLLEMDSLFRDQGKKLAAYARNNVPEYRVLNLVADRLEVYQKPLESEYKIRQIYSPNGVSRDFAGVVGGMMSKSFLFNPKNVSLGERTYRLPMQQIYCRGELYVRPATQNLDNTFCTRDKSILGLSREYKSGGYFKSCGEKKKYTLLGGRTHGSPLRLDTVFCSPTVGAGLVPALTRQSPSHNALQNAGILETALMFSRPAPSQMLMQETSS
jgi:hypothetical protein